MQLKTRPRVSLRLSRARGFVSSSVTPRSSRAGPLVGDVWSPELIRVSIAPRIKSSRDDSLNECITTPRRVGAADHLGRQLYEPCRPRLGMEVVSDVETRAPVRGEHLASRECELQVQLSPRSAASVAQE